MRTKKARARAIAASLAFAFFACGPVGPPKSSEKNKPPRPVMVAAERTASGSRLVVVREDGATMRELTRPADFIVDRSPVFTPDGGTILFTSNRNQADFAHSALFSVSVEGGEPIQLTAGPADYTPQVSPDERYLYWTGLRDGTLVLLRATRAMTGRLGEPEQLTHYSDKQVRSFSLSPDGKHVAFMLTDDAGSSLWRMPVTGGEAKRLTDGPIDFQPAWGPSGKIAFSSLADPEAEKGDLDIYLIPEDGGPRQLLVRAEPTDERAPRWSPDGRFVFALSTASLYEGKVLVVALGNLVFADTQSKRPQLKMLVDPSAIENRLEVAITTGLDVERLSEAPAYDYVAVLRRVVMGMQRDAVNEEEPEDAPPAADAGL